MKPRESTKRKANKDGNGKYAPYLEITEVMPTMIIRMIQESCIHLFLKNHLVIYQIFHPRTSYFEKLLTQNFHILKYGLLIIILNIWR